jgi:hypothetical protein
MSKSNSVPVSGGLLREKAWDIIYALTVLFRFITLQSFFADRREGRAKVTIRDITSTQCDKLTAAGIAFTIAKGPISSDQRGNIALENHCLSAALVALGLSELYRVDGEQGAEIVTIGSDEAVADSKRLTIVGLVSAGTKDRLSYLKAKNRNAAHPLVLVEKQKGLARLIAARLRPVFPGKITVHLDGPAEKKGSELAGDTQHVFISSAVFDTPATLCGIAVNARSKSSYSHTVRGVWITDPVNHYGIGEYYGNYLYFFAGLNTAKNPSDSMRLFENIALEMVEQIDVERLAARAVEHALAVEASLGFSTDEVAGTAVDVQVSGLNTRSGRLVGRLTAALLGPILGPEGKSLASTAPSSRGQRFATESFAFSTMPTVWAAPQSSRRAVSGDGLCLPERMSTSPVEPVASYAMKTAFLSLSSTATTCTSCSTWSNLVQGWKLCCLPASSPRCACSSRCGGKTRSSLMTRPFLPLRQSICCKTRWHT